MRTRPRRPLRLVALVAATAAIPAAAPATAPAARTAASACTFPRAVEDLPVATRFELELFAQQTRHDAGRTSTSAFLSLTVARAAAMTTAIARAAGEAARAAAASPPRCP
ncbi:hypothetical protein GKE82_15720 [Conexibacter sp. W3-3-2]|uniref:hypothetical protein n=1 Tax=Conexibacter sp. W3-3-2 TaxID=2675227 RepID=UPI0012B820B5|nr:hypothetical protein [Conexibacter sp. W3-3-2]MTD45696.1 hypothetical protein [Conexibacter sp. W3-3-2]